MSTSDSFSVTSSDVSLSRRTLAVQRASAGSGKTQLLATSYLRILCRAESEGKPVDPRSIVATTFTREAAGEILARILKLLAAAALPTASGEKARSALAAACDLPTLPASLLERLLRRLLTAIDQLPISTIDAFLGAQARAFGEELGLAPGWEIAMPEEARSLAQKAVIGLLESSRKERKKKEQDIPIALWWQQFHDFGRTWGFLRRATNLLERYRFLQKPEFSQAEFFEQEEQQNPLEEFQELPPQHLSEEQRLELSARILELRLPVGRSGQPDRRWQGAQQKMREVLGGLDRPFLWRDILRLGGPLSSLIAEKEPPSFYGKELPQEWIAFFSPLIAEAKQEEIRLHALREQGFFQLVAAYHRLRSNYSWREGRYGFQEIEEALLSHRSPISLEELLWRLDGQIGHLLLDEYQDTSLGQHRFFAPLMGEVLAVGGEVVVVGDLKQAIYRWRGGRRELLPSLEKEYAPYLRATMPLDQSYRSSPVILEAVNWLFESLQNSFVREKMGADFAAAADAWSQEFHPHRSAERVQALQGRVRFFLEEKKEKEEADFSEEEKKEKGPLDTLLKLIQGHLQEDPQRQIAVLLRRNRWVSELLTLLHHQGIVASGEGGNPLTDTAAGKELLAFCQWVTTPWHQAASQVIEHSPLKILFATEGKDPQHYRQQLLKQGYGKMLQRWSQLYEKESSSYQQARLEQLVIKAYQFEMQGSGHLEDWIRLLQQERVELPATGGVRVLTIHAAKGLEFEAVILADLESPIFQASRDGVRVGFSPQEEPFLLGNRQLMEWQGRKELYAWHQQQGWLEAMSLLYVATTRAVSFLDICLVKTARGGIDSLSKWVQQLAPFPPEETFWQDGKTLRELHFSKEGEKDSSKKRDRYHSLSPQLFPPEEGKKRGAFFPRTSLCSVTVPKKIVVADLFSKNRYCEEGLILHALLAQIEWVEEGSSPDPLHLLQKALPLLQEEFQQVGENFHKKSEQLSSWLSNKFLDAPWRQFFQQDHFITSWKKWSIKELLLWREMPFTWWDQQQQEQPMLRGRWDRVVLGFAPGEKIPRVAKVIDFKLSKIDQEEYQQQLDAYQGALKGLFPSLQEVEGELVSLHETS